MDGDKEALAYLQFEDVDVVGLDTRPITWETLCGNYSYCVHILIVAAKLNLHILPRTARMSLRHASHIARHYYKHEFPEIATTCTVEEFAETLSTVLADVPPAHLSREEDFDSEMSVEKEEEPQCKKRKKGKKKSKKIEKPQKKEEQKEVRSHHVRVKCRIAGCDAKVQDIRRHLKMHIKNSPLHPGHVHTNHAPWQTEDASFQNHLGNQEASPETEQVVPNS